MASPGADDVTRHDVFLSFRGIDTRDTITDHIHEALLRAALRTFRDDDEMERGRDLKTEIETAIKASESSIIVFSENFATSTWCLDELSLILEQMRDCNHIVLPVFYHVDPSDVRKQNGSFKIEVKGDSPRWTHSNVNRWKIALTMAANLTGIVLKGSETKFVKDIVDFIYNKVSAKKFHLPLNLVRMDTRYEDINDWIKQSDDNLLVIWGMGGSGKTTLARYIVYLNRDKFDNISIVEHIGSIWKEPQHLRQLQETLLGGILGGDKSKVSSDSQGRVKIEQALEMKKSLIVLDDIVNLDQLLALLGTGKINHESKIIVTTRDSIGRWFGSRYGRCWEYKMRLLDPNESLELLSLHAFGSKSPSEEYLNLAKQVVKYCDGNPLALEVLGSTLSQDISIPSWESALVRLDEDKDKGLHIGISRVLKTSYDSLPHDYEKELFLHIACFFNGTDLDYVVKIFENDYHAVSSLQTLTNRSLLSISPNQKIMMHQLLQDMGRSIVIEESPKNPAQRSRVWLSTESYDMLINGMASDKVEGLALDMQMLMDNKYASEELSLHTGSLKIMYQLKLLSLKHVKVSGSYNNFSNKLIWLCWIGFHEKTIPPGLSMRNLVALDMSNSCLVVFEISTALQALKILDLKDSLSLEKIHNFNMIPNLETLILCNCHKLIHVCETIGGLKNLVLLNMTGCKSLYKSSSDRMLINPLKMSTTSTSNNGSTQKPSFSMPCSLERLFLNDCELEYTDFSPLNFSDQLSMQYLNLGNNLFEILPNYIHLKNLRVLNLSSCPRLKNLLYLPSTLVKLDINHCESMEKVTFESHRFTLQELVCEGCTNLSEIEGFIKLVPIATLNESDLGHMKWLKEFQNLEMSVVGYDELTESRTQRVQVLYEFGIMSTSLPDIKIPMIMPVSKSEKTSTSVSFKIPEYLKNQRVKGINVTFKYTISGDEWVWFAKISTASGANFIYNPTVFGRPRCGEVGTWLSYWPIGNMLYDRDNVNVSIFVVRGLEVCECDAGLVYTDDEVADETMENSFGWVETLGGDLSAFQLSTEAYYLCRRDFFELMEVGGPSPGWFRTLVSGIIDHAEVRGWRKNGKLMQTNSSTTQLKTVKCIIHGPQSEEIYRIAEFTKSSLLNETVEDADINEIMKSTSSLVIENTEYSDSYLSRLLILMKQDTNSSQEKMNQNIGTEVRQSASNMFNSKVKLSKFLGSLDALPDAYHAILKTSSAYQLHKDIPSGIQILAFTVTPNHTARFLEGGFRLVPSKNHQVVDFISTKENPLFLINKTAVYLFNDLLHELSQIKNQLAYKPLIVTGQSLGGYLAILFTLWLQHEVDMDGHRNNKRPICITFGSPLVGDEALQLAICERPTWKSSFLNVVTKKDPIATLLSSITSYKPFGTFLFCTESGSNSVFEDPDLILAVLDSMGSSNARNLEMWDYGNDLMEIRKKLLYRGVSISGELYLNSFRAGITLQLKEVGVSDNISENLIGRMEKEQAKMMRSKNIQEPVKKLNDMKIRMTYMEWYMKASRSKGGYYDRYKNPYSNTEIESYQVIFSNQRLLNQYWKKIVEEKIVEEKNLRKRWLYGGTTYRRIIEPLDIAEYYQKGYTNYVDKRPFHYQLLEKWLEEERKVSNPSESKKNKAASLNEDSCFWAHVEEALISLRGLRIGGSSNNAFVLERKLEEFEHYLMHAIKDYDVSPDIFLEGSSLMKWWNEYKEYRGDSYASEFAYFMNSKSYWSYQ